MRGDVAKLPKWAQREIDRLESDVRHYRARLAAGPEDSDTFADPYSDGARRPLGKGTLIEFTFGPGWADKIQASLDGDTLRIRGGSGLAVYPSASNSINIKVTR